MSLFAPRDFLIEVEAVERDCQVADAKFQRCALEQEALNKQMEVNPRLAHSVMESVLKAFRNVAEFRDKKEKLKLTAFACKAAFNGDEKTLMLWIEMKQKNTDFPDELEHCKVTPLIAAAMGQRIACCSLLLSVCDKNALDAEGISARERVPANDEEFKNLLA